MEIIYSPANLNELKNITKEDRNELMLGIPKNTYVTTNGRLFRGTLCTDEDFANIDEICLDLGVVKICKQDPVLLINTLGNKIKAVIFRDNNGISDASMMPMTTANNGCPSMDWYGIINALRNIHFDGTIIIDYWDTIAQMPHCMRVPCEQFAHKFGENICWQLSIDSTIRKYPKRVLFGAGNMCRIYMQNYGKDYPPLFTCDNNSKRWGEIFDGLEIKNPNTLKDLESDVAIFICNIYYDEIENQLKEMNLTNPIERFSDDFFMHNPDDALEMWKGNN